MSILCRRELIKYLGYSILDDEISISAKYAALDALERDFNFTIEHYRYRLDGKIFHVTEYIDQISETTQEIRRFHFYSGKNVYAKEWNAFIERGILVDERGRPIVVYGDSDFSDWSDEEEAPDVPDDLTVTIMERPFGILDDFSDDSFVFSL